MWQSQLSWLYSSQRIMHTGQTGKKRRSGCFGGTWTRYTPPPLWLWHIHCLPLNLVLPPVLLWLHSRRWQWDYQWSSCIMATAGNSPTAVLTGEPKETPLLSVLAIAAPKPSLLEGEPQTMGEPPEATKGWTWGQAQRHSRRQADRRRVAWKLGEIKWYTTLHVFQLCQPEPLGHKCVWPWKSLLIPMFAVTCLFV